MNITLKNFQGLVLLHHRIGCVLAFFGPHTSLENWLWPPQLRRLNAKKTEPARSQPQSQFESHLGPVRWPLGLVFTRISPKVNFMMCRKQISFGCQNWCNLRSIYFFLAMVSTYFHLILIFRGKYFCRKSLDILGNFWSVPVLNFHYFVGAKH